MQMSLKNSQLIRSSRKRIFESPIYESLSQSKNLSTMTPNEEGRELKQQIRTTQFSLNTPVNSSIQEAEFQLPVQSMFKIQNTPSFNKKNNNPIVRKELSKYLEESGQLRIDEGQYDSQLSSEESVNSFTKFQKGSLRYQEQQQSSKNSFKENLTEKININQENEESKHSIKISDREHQDNPINSNRLIQNIFSQSKISERNEFLEQKVNESQQIEEIKIDIPEAQQSLSEQSISNQSNWQFNQLDQMIKGFVVIKYCRKEFFGRKKRLFQVTPDLKIIIFRNPDHQITKIYSINKIRKIEKGANTETFRQYKLKPAQQCFCFSIFLDERTVDLSFTTQEQLDQALDCLNGLTQNK